jgi:spore maturation protein CgeB
MRCKLVVLGLSLSSSWGNGHATTYRALLKALHRRDHDILFLEREQPWYAENRDLRDPSFCQLRFYDDLVSLNAFRNEIEQADAVIVGSYVPEGLRVCNHVLKTANGVTAFYDIDTPVTLAKLAKGSCEYLSEGTIRHFDHYLSFSGGAALQLLARHGARHPIEFYCSVDVEAYRPLRRPLTYDLGYLGTYSEDRQQALETLLLDVARQQPGLRFIVAGPLYPKDIAWPHNVERIDHIPPQEHADFYRRCRFTLNITRRDMIELGHSPSVRLFEAAACGAPIISDVWAGLDQLFEPGREILLAHKTRDVSAILTGSTEASRRALAQRARTRILAEHSSDHRAKQLEEILFSADQTTFAKQQASTLAPT